MINLPVNSHPDRAFQILLGENLLTIRTYWNGTVPAWYMDIIAQDETPIALGLALVPVINILEFSPQLTMDFGQFRVITTDENDTPTSLGNTAQVWWYAPNEFENEEDALPAPYSNPATTKSITVTSPSVFAYGDGIATGFKLPIDTIATPPVIYQEDSFGNQQLYSTPRTNVTIRSEELNNAAWPRSALTTVTPNVVIAPDGEMTADMLVPTAVVTNHYVESLSGLGALPDNFLVACAIFVKKKDFGRALLQFVVKNGSGPSLEFRFADERITSAAQGIGNTNVTFSVNYLPNGWYRLVMNNISVSTGATAPRLRVFVSDDVGVGSGLWGKSGAVGMRDVTPAPTSAPTWTGDSLIETAVNNLHNSSLTHVFRAGKALIFEAYFKEIIGSAKRYGVILVGTGTPMSGNQGCVIDAALGTIVFTAGTAGTYQIADAGDGWWKVTARFMPTGSGNQSVQLRLSNVNNTVTPSYLGDGTSGLYVAAPYGYAEVYVPSEPVYVGSATAQVLGDAVKGTYAWGGMTVLEPAMSRYIMTGATSATVTDYTITSGGLVITSETPEFGAIMRWTGSGTAIVPENKRSELPFDVRDLYRV